MCIEVYSVYFDWVLALQYCFDLCVHTFSADGLVQGPLAYFGRYHRSLLMTRSLGDHLGPRGCIALCELTAITLPVDRHAR